jgi:hypothetical protein
MTAVPHKGVKESSGAQAAPEWVGHPRLPHSPGAASSLRNRPANSADRWGEDETNPPIVIFPPILLYPPEHQPPLTPEQLHERLRKQLEEMWLSIPYAPNHHASLDANCTRGGANNTGNNLPMRPAPAPRPCAAPGRGPDRPSSTTKTIDCPCTGKVTVNCTEHDDCVFYSMGGNGAITYTLVTVTECPCPEYKIGKP